MRLLRSAGHAMLPALVALLSLLTPSARGAAADWTGGRRVYHFGLPLSLRAHGPLLTDAQFQGLLAGILRACACTAYDRLGPLRLHEPRRWLLVENPNGTSGTVETLSLPAAPTRTAGLSAGLTVVVPAEGGVVLTSTGHAPLAPK